MMTVADLALALWREQYEQGVTDMPPDPAMLDAWMLNRTLPYAYYERAAAGEVEDLIEVRIEAGLDVFR